MQDRQWKVKEYARDMPDYMKKHPDRDYSVNRAERRKQDKLNKAKKGNK